MNEIVINIFLEPHKPKLLLNYIKRILSHSNKDPAAQFFFIERNREYALVLVRSTPVAATLSLDLCSEPHQHSLRFTHAVATPELFSLRCVLSY